MNKSTTFQNETTIEWIQLLFIKSEETKVTNPFDSIWLKLVALGAYIICLISSGIVLAFTIYEKKYHGHFRTVINQLLSNLYGMVISLH